MVNATTALLIAEDSEMNSTLSAEDIRGLFEETARRFQETDRKFQETDRFLKELGKQIGGLGNKLVL